MVPLTTGVAMLVPLRLRYGRYEVGIVPGSREDAIDVYIALAGSLRDSMPTPGATRSGFADASMAPGPRELNTATVSSLRSIVPIWLDAPTVSTQGALPGAVTPPYCPRPSALRPLFPAAATTTMPALTALSAASVSGSAEYDPYTGAAIDKLMTRMFSASLFATA